MGVKVSIRMRVVKIMQQKCLNFTVLAFVSKIGPIQQMLDRTARGDDDWWVRGIGMKGIWIDFEGFCVYVSLEKKVMVPAVLC